MNAAGAVPITHDLVLLGGGHSHVAVLRAFGMRPVPGCRVTLISREIETPYSGMLPGLVAGHYHHDEAHIDLQRLGRFAGARVIAAEATGLDLASRHVHVSGRPPLAYDLLSIDIGSTPLMAVPGAAAHAVAVKPIDSFLARWDAMRERLAAAGTRRRVAVVGGGAGGVELLLAVQYRMRSSLAASGRSDAHLEYHLFTGADGLLPTHAPRVRQIFGRILVQRDVHVHTRGPVVQVAADRLRTADGRDHGADEILWTTQAGAAPWLAAAGLAVDDAGFVRVSTSLQSVSHPEVFAAGDIAAMDGHPRPKSGVFAVRQGRPLARNLRRALRGRPLTRYYPQRRVLGLISTGDRSAVASRGALAVEGAWLWRWKDRIDRRFMRRYTDLPEVRVPRDLVRRRRSRLAIAAPTDPPDAAGAQAPWSDPFRCGGCGAKVGAHVLGRALQRACPTDAAGIVIGLDQPDDAAVFEWGDGTMLVHTVDFFRALIDDPYAFGQVAASHALGDVYAMGANPQAALAIVTVPPGSERATEDTLVQLMAGATSVLRDAGASLAGGHTAEGTELALGFAVHGRATREDLLRKAGLQPGDCLLLTKALGTGTLFAADMRHRARARWIAAAVASMRQLPREALTQLRAHDVRACTDVTGFGLAGHLIEMLRASGVDAELDLDALPVLPGAEETARAGFLSSLHPANARAASLMAAPPAALGHPRYPLLFDPQTAGGLLAGVPAGAAPRCLAALRANGCMQAAMIGRIRERQGRSERVTLRVRDS